MLPFSSSYLRILLARAGARPPVPRSCLRTRAFANRKDDPPLEGAPLLKQYPPKAEARATHLHNEIESIVKKHDRYRAQEAEKATNAAGFVEFLRKQQTNLSIIVVSFLTLVLSVKMVQQKQKYEELVKELKDTRDQLEIKRKLLKAITSEAFLSKIAEDYANLHRRRSHETTHYRGRGWTTGSSNSREATTETPEGLVAILEKDLFALIGDADLTEHEKKVKQSEELRALGKENEFAMSKLVARSASSGAREPLEEWVKDADRKKTVMKSIIVL